MVDFEITYRKTLKEEGGLSDNPNDLGGLTIMGVCYRDWNHKHPKLFETLNNYIKLVDLASLYNLSIDYPEQKKQKRQMIINAKNKIYELCLGNTEFVKDIKAIYKTYWDKMKLDLLVRQSDANTIFDFGFNAGTGRAIRYAQRVAGVTEDAIMGKITANAINNTVDFTKKYNDARKIYYNKISKNGNQAVFLGGWLKRVEKFYV